MTQYEKLFVIDLLERKGVTKSCSKCGKNSFELTQKTDIVLSNNRVMPSALLLCAHCGDVCHFALGVLSHEVD